MVITLQFRAYPALPKARTLDHDTVRFLDHTLVNPALHDTVAIPPLPRLNHPSHGRSLAFLPYRPAPLIRTDKIELNLEHMGSWYLPRSIDFGTDGEWIRTSHRQLSMCGFESYAHVPHRASNV